MIALWFVLIALCAAAALALGAGTNDTIEIPGVESQEALEDLSRIYPEAAGTSAQVVVELPDGVTTDDDAARAGIDEAVRQLSGVEQIASVASPYDDLVSGTISEDRATAIITAQYAVPMFDVTESSLAGLEHTAMAADDGLPEGSQIHLGGEAFSNNVPEPSATEAIGIVLALIFLYALFRSLKTAVIPLFTALIGVAVTELLIQASTGSLDVMATAPMLALMIGLAVGIDYALFIVSRFRNELVAFAGGNNMTPKELAAAVKKTTHAERAHLAGLAVGKAGSAVCFAGLTVVIALAALSIINIPFLTAMALAAAFTVVIAVLVAITLLPAILGAFGARSFAGRAPVVKAPDPEDEKPTMGLKWVRQVRKRPVIFAAASALLLVLLAIPVASLQLAMPTDDSAKLGSPQRNAAEWVNEDFGPGRNAPMIAVVKDSGDDPMAAQATFGEAVATISGVDGVENAQVAGMSEDGTAAMVMITPTTGGNDALTADTLQSLRDAEPAFKDQTGGTYSITGVTPIFEDVSDRLSEVLIPYVAIVVVLAFVLLVVVFRSLWVPLIAALGFALSVAATFGVTVAVWQWGWLGITNDPQPIISFLPIMLIGIVFGLAMDYQVFLVTRMREGYVHGKTAGNAVSNGFKHGARVVTAAALIMISVFAAFVLMDEPFIAVMGSALAMAVLIDAFVVRMTIVPAVLFLLGDRAWKLPAWLDKIIPSVDVEGTTLEGMEATTDEKKAVETAPSNG